MKSLYNHYEGKSKSTKKVLVAVPKHMLEAVDQAADAECRTRSDYIREALRTQLRVSLMHQNVVPITSEPQQVGVV